MRMEFVRSLHQRPFVRNVAIVASGTLVAQIIAIVFTPIITRIYGPDAFGAAGVFSSLLMIVGPIAALSYPIAIVLPDHDYEAVALVKVSLLIAGCLSALFALIIYVFGDNLIVLLQIEQIKPWILLLPIAMFASAGYQVMQQWVIRQQLFGASARIDVIHSLTVNIAKTGGYFQPVAGVLIMIAAIAPGLRAVMLALSSRWPNASQRRETNKSGIALEANATMKTATLTYCCYPLYRAPQSLINAVSQSLPVLILARFEGAAAAGLYVLATQMLALPSMLIGQSVSSVFYPRFAEAARKGEDLTRLLGHATLSLAVVGAVPYGLVMLCGPWLFGFTFGDAWYTSGEYSRWLAVWWFFGFINRPSFAAIPTLELERCLLTLEVASTTARIAALIVGFTYFSQPIAAIILLSIVGALGNVVLIGFVYLVILKHSQTGPRTPPLSGAGTR